MKPTIFEYDFKTGGKGYIDLNKVVAITTPKHDAENFFAYVGTGAEGSDFAIPLSRLDDFIEQWKQGEPE